MTELGSRLRMAREEKGISLDELQNITKIQKRYLVGIEEGNYGMMPGKFYVRAFIKQYAEAVGLQPEQLFDEYKNDIPPAYEDDMSERLSRVQSRSGVSRQTSKIMEYLPKVLTGIVIVAFLFLVWFLVTNYLDGGNKPEQPKGKESVNYKESENVVPPADEKKGQKGTDEGQPKEEPAEEPEKEQPEQKLETAGTSGILTTYNLTGTDTFSLKVSAITNGETWVKISSGNKTLFQGMLSNGASQTFDLSAETEAYIVAGNSGNTEISINDEKLEYALSPEQAVKQDIRIQFEKKAE